MKAKVNNLVVISDLHAGCRLGLCPPEGVPLDDGGIYKPSPLQLVMWQWWEEFWDVFVPAATKREPFDVVVNGDGLDGVPHNAVTGISNNMEDQCAALRLALAPTLQRQKHLRRLYWVRGTEAHVGKSASFEERMARELGAKPNREGQFARWELWKSCGDHLVHFLHHVGTTSSSAHESSAVNAELVAEYVEAARWGERPPNVIVRSHRHRNIEVRIPGKAGIATAVVTPAWQLKTPFAFKIAGARLAPPQIGGIVIRSGDRNIFTDPFVRHIARAPVEH